MTLAKPASLHAYLAATRLVPLVAKRVLQRRLERGKEHPDRWREKLGEPSAVRPEGPLIWINAVGLGEIMSLRGFINAVHDLRPDLHVLVTSTTRQSAQVFGANAPDGVIHQFLPLDAPQYRRRFLDHWRPDAMIWAEQDLWPGFVDDLSKRGIPQALIAGRMNDAAAKRHARAKRLYRHLYGQMARMDAQDRTSADHLSAASGLVVTASGSLKPAAPALSFDYRELEVISKAINRRFTWLLASSYAADEALALEAHKLICQAFPDALLIVAPRDVKRDLTLTAPSRSLGQLPAASDAVWLADTVGEMGLWGRLARIVMMGGTNNDIEGHNPWEFVTLGKPVLHGPRVANFKADYADLDAAGVAFPVETAESIATTVTNPTALDAGELAQKLIAAAQTRVQDLTQRVLAALELDDA